MEKLRPTIITFTVLLSIVSSSIYSQEVVSCAIKNNSFGSGEQLTYVLSYTWFFIWTDVGEATFTVKQDEKFGQDALHLHTYGMSYPFYDVFFKVRDIYESWVDPNSLQPIYFNRDINEGGYTKENEYVFDWENGLVNARIRRRGGENRFYEVPVNPCTYDVVTAIYVARNLDFSNLSPNQSFPVDVMLDREVYNVSYTYMTRELKKIKNIGTFSTLKFRVELVAGDVFKEGQYLFVWVTDDANRIPVYIESPIRVGTVKARILNWEGLKYNLTSKVN
ncbi:DUF3108 domain-containing protein [Perlabentimonas gracilis]|uniref:DUF3108 domain-containing protein n=1 Tax=Perlabentimonas gracilis TaxID=2715279 RepID=UPI00140BFF6E|nr:DUF3108 domain-containing protein [Perlabentimonas gracilis]NHB68744.1 DUF3108 domain-containing protein [Perlabentimonas gracilis]